MSNSLAIASVTATIRGLIALEGITVTAQSPDRVAQDNAGGNRVNIFLYHTMPNAAWRNADMPGQVRPGESGHPPLALNLFYLLTAYGTDGLNSELAAHKLLGQAMLALHDRPVLTKDDIRNLTQGDPQLQDADVDQQVEQVRITPDPLSLEDLSRMWTTFQTQYRVSAAYQASVVLIESRRPTKAPLPVLKRGSQDQGVISQLGFGPLLTGVAYRSKGDPPVPRKTRVPRKENDVLVLQERELPAAAIGETITLMGTDLPAQGIEAVVRDPHRGQQGDPADSDIVRTIAGDSIQRRSGGDIRIALPADGNWNAGTLSIELTFPASNSAAGQTSARSTNAVPLAIAPQLRMHPDGQGVLFNRTIEDGKTYLHLTPEFPLGENRRVFLILSELIDSQSGRTNPRSYQVPQARDDLGTGQFSPRFDITNVESAEYRLRLRVDGVDSLLITREEFDVSPGVERKDGFAFDERYKVQL